MKERDYIAASNIARLYILNDVLRWLTVGEIGVAADEYRQVCAIVHKWTEETQKAMNP